MGVLTVSRVINKMWPAVEVIGEQWTDSGALTYSSVLSMLGLAIAIENGEVLGVARASQRERASSGGRDGEKRLD